MRKFSSRLGSIVWLFVRDAKAAIEKNRENVLNIPNWIDGLGKRVCYFNLVTRNREGMLSSGSVQQT